MTMPARAVLLVHGGAGVINPDSMSGALEARYKGLEVAFVLFVGQRLQAGEQIVRCLKHQRPSLHAVLHFP